MPNKKLTVILIACIIGFAGCKKDRKPQRCEAFIEALANENWTVTRSILAEYIGRLPSQKHTEENLHLLATYISDQCDMNVEVLCYKCLDSNPPQSVMKFTFIYSGTTMSKTLNLISISTSDDRLKLSGIHTQRSRAIVYCNTLR